MFGITKRLAMIVLSIWLIAKGLLAVTGASLPDGSFILNLLAIVAGSLILLQGRSWSEEIGMVLLGVWVLVTGLLSLVNIDIQSAGLILNLVAIAAGALILVRK
ncbi:MAG: hypothetical protein R6V13_11725 [Anaerolineae bacterium]